MREPDLALLGPSLPEASLLRNSDSEWVTTDVPGISRKKYHQLQCRRPSRGRRLKLISPEHEKEPNEGKGKEVCPGQRELPVRRPGGRRPWQIQEKKVQCREVQRLRSTPNAPNPGAAYWLGPNKKWAFHIPRSAMCTTNSTTLAPHFLSPASRESESIPIHTHQLIV